ncbi:MAG: PAS domain S-box protein [Pseudomonadota bacterium]
MADQEEGSPKMAEDERLREALLELQLLRDREAKSLQETRNLVRCLEAYSSATTPGEALHSIFVSLRNTIGATLSMLGEVGDDGTFTVLASDDRDLINCRMKPPFDLSTRSRDILNLHLLGPWSGLKRIDRFKALQSVPILSNSTAHAMVVLKEAPSNFEKGSMQLVERLAGLAMRALQGTKIADENKLLAAAIHGSSSGFAIADATQDDRPLIYVNQAFEKISGYSASEVLGTNCRFLTAEPEDSGERRRLRETVAQNGEGTFLLRNKRKDGTPFWNELTLFPVEGENGGVKSLVATQNDVSQRVEAAAERDRTRAQMDKALTATEDAFLVLDAGHIVSFSNDATRDVFPAHGFDWLPGTSFKDNWGAYLEASRDMPGRITSIIANPDLSGLARLPNGREIDLPDGRTVLVRASAFSDGGVVFSATDVTQMKSAQRLLSQRLASIEAAQDGIATTDDHGRLTYLNSAAAMLLGYDNLSTGLGRYWHKQYDDGDRMQGSIAFAVTLTRSIKGRERTHEVTGTKLESGGSVIVFRDVTDRLAFKAREAELKAGLQQLQRQEATAQLAAGIAHDFNNLLSAINGSATLIGLEENLTESLKSHVSRISAAGNQAAKLVNRLLDLGSTGNAGGAFDVGSVLTDIRAILAPSLSNDIDLQIERNGENVALTGDAAALSQVIVNLALNARDSIGENQGAIIIETRKVNDNYSQKVEVGELLPSMQYLRLDVRDTGHGIDAEHLGSVFQPYFSTKGRHGTGLGLAMVAIQVQAIGGAVSISSTSGQGTTVSIFWPIARAEAGGTSDTETSRHDLTGQTIIIVDDDFDVAMVAANYLEAQGAEVSVCVDPTDAIEAIEDDPGAWTAVVTDYDMPDMTGGDVAERIKALRSDIPIILVTALARRLSDPRVNNGTIDVVLAKPTDLNHLSSVLCEYHVKNT